MYINVVFKSINFTAQYALFGNECLFKDVREQNISK